MNATVQYLVSGGIGLVLGFLPGLINPYLEKLKIARYQEVIRKVFSLLDLVVGQVGIGLTQRALYDLVKQAVIDAADGTLSEGAIALVANYVLKKFDIQVAATTASKQLPIERVETNIEQAKTVYLSARELLGVKPAGFNLN
jgi:hypothetical protein